MMDSVNFLLLMCCRNFKEGLNKFLVIFKVSNSFLVFGFFIYEVFEVYF